MQPDIPDLQRGPLPDVNAHKVGGILVEYVDMAQPIEEQLPADGARERGKEGHGSGRDPWTVGNSSAYRWERNGSISGGRRWGAGLVEVAEGRAPLLYQHGYAELCLPSLGPSLAAVV